MKYQVLVKPIGPICNLRCAYCYYLDGAAGFEIPNDRLESVMSDEILEKMIRQYIRGSQSDCVEFVWHGGEPTLLGLNFFRRVVELQDKFAESMTVTNCIQTNGVLLNDRWCEFLADRKFLVGVSIDGPEECHNAFRLTKNRKPTFAPVVSALELVRKHGVEFNTLTCVHSHNVNKPKEVYSFLKSIGTKFIQFIPIVPRSDADRDQVGAVDSRDFGDFLSAVFDEWVLRDVGQVYVQMFDTALEAWLGLGPGLCTFAETCGKGPVIEHNGDVFSCDHFVNAHHLLGNIRSASLDELVKSQFQLDFGLAKTSTLSAKCRRCKYRFACAGGCPKDRKVPNKGLENQNYLCDGYYRFFEHIDQPMKFMANEIRNRRPPSNIMVQRAILNIDPPE